MNNEEKQEILKAGKIAKEVREWIKPQVKKGDLLLDIAEKIENKIVELGGKPAFPTNLSINEVAAHYTPSHDDESKAQGLLKIDFGVHVDGYISDNATSIDLEGEEENKKLIEASQKALDNALETIKTGIKNGDVGKVIQSTIEEYGFSPIINLFGHEIDRYDLHSGITIPNTSQGNDEIEEGQYAIEPFATTGSGKVYDGPDSGIYVLVDDKNVRSQTAREVLNYIIEEHKTLPFCSRWLVKKFGTKALLGLRELERNGNLHQFSQLIEVSKSKVAQSEHTLILTKNETIVTTK